MDRKKAIFSIILTGGGIAVSFSGYQWPNINRTPDLSYLDNHAGMIADLADVIIPRTDTPGAKDAGVSRFIICMVKEICDHKAQNNFINGLREVEAYASDHYGRGFSDLDTAQRQEIVTRFRQKGQPRTGLAGKVERRIMGKSFFATLREAAIIGYCTSRQGATRALAYDFMPGGYTGCISAAGQRSWATK